MARQWLPPVDQYRPWAVLRRSGERDARCAVANLMGKHH
jgi:hypothetical protein